MTDGQTSRSESSMESTAENTGGVSGMMNLTINLPDNIRISTVDSDETEESEVTSANATGTIVAFAAATAPDGWLLCNGAEVSRATYADLFTLIGTDYGVGNGNTTFNLPDLRGRFALGQDNMGEVSADRVTDTEADELGGVGGEETHTLTVDEMPSHTHPLKTGAITETTPETFSRRSDRRGFIDTGLMGSAGSDAAHNNMPPYQTVNYVIKT